MDSSRQSPVLVVVVLIGMICTPVLYFLSLGPAYWLLNGGHISEATFEVIYAPLIFLADCSVWVDALCESYLLLFE